MSKPTEVIEKEYVVNATYKVEKELILTVVENGDPMNPDDWKEILGEMDLDCWLYDTNSYTEND